MAVGASALNLETGFNKSAGFEPLEAESTGNLVSPGTPL